LFWVSAIAPFMVVIIGGVFAFLVKGDEHGIPIVSAAPFAFVLFRLQKRYVLFQCLTTPSCRSSLHTIGW
jgi:hypothetical protein